MLQSRRPIGLSRDIIIIGSETVSLGDKSNADLPINVCYFNDRIWFVGLCGIALVMLMERLKKPTNIQNNRLCRPIVEAKA